MKPMPSNLQKVEALLAEMSPNERAALIPKVLGEAAGTFPGIEKTPGVCGGSACIIRTRIPVWTLVSFRNLGLSDEQLLENYPSLRHQDLINAWNYYLTNKEEIDSDILENNEP